MIWWWGCYLLIFSSGMEYRTLSQICGRLYFPMFLFRVGLFTLTYMVSLMALAILFHSLPMILKFSTHVVWPVLLWLSEIGDGAFRCSLHLSPNILDPLCIPHHSQSYHICTNRWHCFSLSLYPYLWERLVCSSVFVLPWSVQLCHACPRWT